MAQLGGQSSSSSMFKMLETSPSKRNKRKSAEPMKRLSSNSEQDIIDNQKSEHRLPLGTQFKNYSNSHQTSTGQNEKCYYKRPKLEQTSDGEDHHTSPSPRLSSRYVLFKLRRAVGNLKLWKLFFCCSLWKKFTKNLSSLVLWKYLQNFIFEEFFTKHQKIVFALFLTKVSKCFQHLLKFSKFSKLEATNCWWYGSH